MPLFGNGGGIPLRAREEGISQVLSSLSFQCHHFDLEDFDCEENTNVPRVRHGGELRERLFTSVCVDGAQSGIGGVDSWGSLPLMKYRLTLKAPIRWAFALQVLDADALLFIVVAVRYGVLWR